MVRALAPLGELRDFAGTLRGVTGGSGTFTVELAQYEPVPKQTHDKLVSARAEHRKIDEEE